MKTSEAVRKLSRAGCFFVEHGKEHDCWYSPITKNMKRVNVIVERGSDNRYSAYMDYYDLDFGLAGFGATPKMLSLIFTKHTSRKKEWVPKREKRRLN